MWVKLKSLKFNKITTITTLILLLITIIVIFVHGRIVLKLGQHLWKNWKIFIYIYVHVYIRIFFILACNINISREIYANLQ